VKKKGGNVSADETKGKRRPHCARTPMLAKAQKARLEGGGVNGSRGGIKWCRNNSLGKGAHPAVPREGEDERGGDGIYWADRTRKQREKKRHRRIEGKGSNFTPYEYHFPLVGTFFEAFEEALVEKEGKGTGGNRWGRIGKTSDTGGRLGEELCMRKVDNRSEGGLQLGGLMGMKWIERGTILLGVQNNISE